MGGSLYYRFMGTVIDTPPTPLVPPNSPSSYPLRILLLLLGIENLNAQSKSL